MMTVPNLLSLLLLADTVAQEALAFQPLVEHRRSKGSRRRSGFPEKTGKFPVRALLFLCLVVY